jgi:hypothetical protein
MRSVWTVFAIILTMAMMSVGTATAEERMPDGKRSWNGGGFGGPCVKAGGFSGTPLLFLGGRGGVRVTKSLALGGGGYYGFPVDQAGEVGLGYGGLWVAYAFFPDERLDLSLETLVGAGGAGYEASDGGERSSPFLAVEPGINLHLRLTNFFSISPGVRYLWTRPGALPAPGGGDIGGLQATIMLRFGRLR